jgi:hypothetical protein
MSKLYLNENNNISNNDIKIKLSESWFSSIEAEDLADVSAIIDLLGMREGKVTGPLDTAEAEALLSLICTY